MVFTADEAESRAQKGEAIILVRIETSPEDIHGMHAARGILTTRGGMTSHAAVVARGMGRPCVAGAGGISVDYDAQTLSAGGKTVRAGETITLDGAAGEVFVGTVAMIEPAMSDDFATLMGWADEARTLGVRANAETPLDAETAKKFGADGIGLCRTEHMFFDPERIGAVRQMIMASDEAGRRAALARLLPFQRDDFHELFRIMGDLPVTIRLLDPPLHEFLPHADAELEEVAQSAGRQHRGDAPARSGTGRGQPDAGPSRLPAGRSTYPEIYEMQARAIFEGALAVAKETGKAPVPEIMIPLVGVKKELEITRAQVDRVAEEVFARGRPADRIQRRHDDRAAARGDRGGQDRRGGRLLQLRHQRPDADRVRPVARRRRASSCRSMSSRGSCRRTRSSRSTSRAWARWCGSPRERGRKTKANLKLGICGEHGGDPASIAFCQQVGLDYVSCSPYRVPVARLAAAQAALGVEGDRTA